MVKNDLGNVLKMTDKDIHLTISDMSFKELVDESPITQVSNALIISAPQDSNNEDTGYYGIFASDYKGNLVPLTIFNKINSNQFKTIYNGQEMELNLSEVYLRNFIYNIIGPELNNLVNSFNNTINNLNNKIDDNHRNLEDRISSDENYINNVNERVNSLNKTISNLENRIWVLEHTYNGSYNGYNPIVYGTNIYNYTDENVFKPEPVNSDNNWEYNF